MTRTGTSVYPGAIDSFDRVGTANYEDEVGYEIVNVENEAMDALEKIQTTLGTTSDTNIINEFKTSFNEIAYNAKDYGATGDGVTDDTTDLQSWLTASAGKTALLPAGDYLISTGLTVSADTTILAYGARIFNTTDKVVFLNLTDGCKVYGLEIEGLGRVTEDTVYSTGIKILGTAADYVEDITIRDCYLHGFQGWGVYMKWVSHALVENCKIFEVGYGGVQTLSCSDVKVNHNHIKGVGAGDTVNCYNISFTRGNTVSDTLSENCTADGNLCEDNLLWKALDTHGGHNIKFLNNTVINCVKGIELKYSEYGGATVSVGEDCLISGNTIFGIPGGGTIYGIYCSGGGATSMYGKNVVITNNILYECGQDLTTPAIYAYFTNNVIISNNHIYQAYGCGIFARNANRISIIGNVIEDVQSSVSGTYGISAYSGVTGVINGNHIVLNNAVLNNYVGEIGIYIRESVTSDIEIGLSNFVTFTTPYSVSNIRVHYGEMSANNSKIFAYNATPEGAIAAPIGSLCINTAGGTATTLYVKESGSGSAGWVGK